ncbi:MAG: hypothetical protein LC101_00065 [Flavobacteriales bacterium]|nr:hypothetical protein [Flavobacteriales bacterium]
MIRRYNYRVALGEATFELLPTGDGTGYAILRMEASETTTLSIRGGDAKFYTDNSGAGESSTWTITSGAIRSIFVKCTSRSLLVFPKQGVITKWGISTSLNGWSSKINAPLISSVGFPLRNLTHLHLSGQCEFSGSLPSGLTYLYLLSSNINWTYSGSLPSGLTSLTLNGSNINWTYSGSLPSGLTYLYLLSSNINWTFSGSLPSGLTSLTLNGSNINWTYSGSLPSGLTSLTLNGSNINWTAFDASGSGNITTYYRLLDFVTTAFSVTNFISLLQSMVSRVGGLPTTCIISDYDNNPTPDEIKNATPNQSGTDAEKAKHWVEQLRSVKGVTSLILNNTNIS